jgi:hypothetical protein
MDAHKTHRLILWLLLEITPGPDSKPGEMCQVVVPLKRDGNSAGRSGLPRPPKQRSIDLRVGDEVLSNVTWRKVLAIEAYREHLLTEDEAANLTHEQGYLYRPAELQSKK